MLRSSFNKKSNKNALINAITHNFTTVQKSTDHAGAVATWKSCGKQFIIECMEINVINEGGYYCTNSVQVVRDED